MHTFKEYLLEIFDSSDKEYEWENEDEATQKAKFTVGRFPYEVEFKRKANKKDWEIKFALVGKFDSQHYELTKTGNEFKVFANVTDIVSQFIKNHRPQVLYFTFDKNSPESREGIYEKLLKAFNSKLGKLGYTSTKDSNSSIPKFMIHKTK